MQITIGFKVCDVPAYYGVLHSICQNIMYARYIYTHAFGENFTYITLHRAVSDWQLMCESDKEQ